MVVKKGKTSLRRSMESNSDFAKPTEVLQSLMVLDIIIAAVNLNGRDADMPVLSTFFGIIVRMYKEASGKHNMPNIHAEYSGDEVVVALDGTVLEGKIPVAKMKLLEAWIVIHQDDLEANWKLLSNGEQFFRMPDNALTQESV